MDRSSALARLRGLEAEVRAQGATALFLFGSAARDEAHAGSDLDLFVDYDAAKPFSLLDLVDIKLMLEERLGIDVDLTTRDSLSPALREDIERAAVRVF